MIHMSWQAIRLAIRHAAVVAGAGLALATSAVAQCDTDGPVLVDFSLSAAAVDTSLAPQDVLCTMTLTDEPAGIREAVCQLVSPVYVQSHSCVAEAPAIGSQQDGTFTCTVRLPRHAEQGTWTASVDVADQAGNRNTFISLDLLAAGLPAALEVTSEQDVQLPVVTSFSLTPAAVDVSSGVQMVSCAVGLDDAPAGTAVMECTLTAPGQEQRRSCQAVTPASGSEQSGLFQCAVAIPEFAQDGLWQATLAFLDSAGNGGYLSSGELQGAGFSAAVTVTSVPADTTPPAQTGFNFNPALVDAGTGARMVTCSMDVTDDLAGVDSVGCTFLWIDPLFTTLQFQSCTSDLPAAGNRLAGTFQCDVVLPQYSAAGFWFSSTVLLDAAGNSAEFDPPGLLEVQCSAAVPAMAPAWAVDAAQLSWDPVPGALAYNVYRATGSVFTDLDGDGLPDGGYGDCMNAMDSDLTDTSFLDPELPAPTDQVFYYLLSFEDPVSEQGLGATSDGIARGVNACP